MKIVLTTLPREGEYKSWITPSVVEPEGVKHLPLGLLSLATNICDYADVVVLDPFSERWSISETIERISKENPDIVGFSAITRRAYSLSQLLVKIDCKWKIVGGPHITYHAEDVLAQGADTVFIGGLADNDLAEWIKNPRKGIIKCTTDINEILFPSREFLDYDSYVFRGGKVLFEAKNRMSMFSSIGCPQKCSFCSVQTKTVYRKYPSMVVEEMQYLKKIGANSIHIMDDNFNTNNNHTEHIIKAMKSSHIDTEWSFRGQVKFNLALVDRMKEIGLKRVHVGIEAINDDVLAWHNKNHRVVDIMKFCEALKRNQVDILGYFIVGAPCETKNYIAMLPDLIAELGINQPYVNVLFPEADTGYYYYLLKNGMYKHDFWSEYMRSPVPNFELPAPFGNEKLQETIMVADAITRKFSGL